MKDAPAASPVLAVGRPVMAGGSPEADDEARAAGIEPGADVGVVVSDDFGEPALVGPKLNQPEILFVALVCAIVTVAFGIYPEPLLDVAKDAGAALSSLI